MDVIFESNAENRFTMQVDGYGTLYFKKGFYKTQDKDLIKKLISHDLKKRNDYKMVTNDEMVANYLSGKESDVLTEEILDEISRQGIIELGKATNTQETQPVLIKVELVGEPITNKVQEILDFYRLEKTKDEVQEEDKSDEVDKVEEFRNEISTDMNASEAVSYIEDTDLEDLKGFVPEEEERVTVLRAWEDKNNSD